MTGVETSQVGKDVPQTGGGGAGAATDVHLPSSEAGEYLEGVRAALADLPASEVAEILDDVRAHLTDLATEIGDEADTGALTARLGRPSTYAAELRTAAGYPSAPAAEQSSHRRAARLAVAGLVASTLLVPLGLFSGTSVGVLLALLPAGAGMVLITRDGPGVPSVAALPKVRRLAALRPATGTTARGVDFLVSLQPAWWVARAFAAASLLVVELPGGVAAAVLLTLFAAPVSVWLGHRTRRDRRWLWAVVPLNGLAAMMLLVLLAGGSDWSGSSSASTSTGYRPGLWQDSEREIHDIRPVDAAGNPLTGVYLFDQDGRPIDTSRGVGCEVSDGDGRQGYAADRSGVESPYPRGTWEFDPRTDECRYTPPGPLVVAVPSTTTPGTATAGPTVVPRPSPSAAAPTTGAAPGPPTSRTTVAPRPNPAPPSTAPPAGSAPPEPGPAPAVPPTP